MKAPGSPIGPGKNPETWRVRVFFFALAVLAMELVWLSWPFSLTYLRTQNPPRTSMMAFRENQARALHRPYHIRQQWVPLERISPLLQKAVISAEDDMFYQHAGVDFNDLWESVKTDWKQKRYVRGGSSLTQQVAKNLFLSPKKQLARKLKELFLAFRLDHTLGKKRVLEIYLNIAEWGPGLFGAEAAARTYFHKSAANLNLEEALSLAAVLPSPLKHSPVQNGRYVQWRKAWILDRLQRYGHLRFTPVLAPPGPPDWVESEETDEGAGMPAVVGDTLNAASAEAVPEPTLETGEGDDNEMPAMLGAAPATEAEAEPEALTSTAF